MAEDSGRALREPALLASLPEPASGLGPTGDDPARWTPWHERRPEDPKALYRWRVPPRMILGMFLRPEWTDKLSYVGMGYDPHEYWPSFSHWDGYRRTLPAGTEWRLAADDEKDIFWGGLDLFPSPFTGKPPKVEFSGRWICAPPYEAKHLKIVSYMIGFNAWENAKKMQEAWNRRPCDSDQSGEAGQTAKQAGPEGRERGAGTAIAQTVSPSPQD